MSDIFTVKKRQEIMSKIRSKNTKLDLTMWRILKRSHFEIIRYPDIFGHPDFLVDGRLALFCDSSFWHGKNWTVLKKKLERGNNANYWIKHIRKNRSRDRLVTRKLTLEGYVVVRLWDTSIYKNPELCLEKIKELLS